MKRDQPGGHEQSGTEVDAQIHGEGCVGGHLQEAPAFGSNFLNVDIPNIKMERYSVMFGSLLADGPSPSLLARRSKTLGMINIQEVEVCFMCHDTFSAIAFDNP